MENSAMPKLWPKQIELVKQMVEAVEAGCRSRFVIMNNSRFHGVVFEGDKGQHKQITCEYGDLVPLDGEKLITLRADGFGVVLPAAMDFAKTGQFPESSAGGDTYNIHAPVGAIQSGQGNTATIEQNINPGLAETLAAIQECRSLITADDAEAREAKEALADLEDELKSKSPKKSRALSFLQTASKYAAATSTLATSFAKLAPLVAGFFIPS